MAATQPGDCNGPKFVVPVALACSMAALVLLWIDRQDVFRPIATRTAET
jgi:hypothetical protein